MVGAFLALIARNELKGCQDRAEPEPARDHSDRGTESNVAHPGRPTDMTDDYYRVTLPASEQPTQWYNIVGDLQSPRRRGALRQDPPFYRLVSAWVAADCRNGDQTASISSAPRPSEWEQSSIGSAFEIRVMPVAVDHACFAAISVHFSCGARAHRSNSRTYMSPHGVVPSSLGAAR